MTDVEYDASVPGDIAGIFAQHLNPWLPLIPTWCHHLIVQWIDSKHESTLESRVSREYRTAHIAICPAWLTKPPAERDRDVCHELVHILLDPSHNAMIDLKRLVVKDHPELETWADELRRDAVEQIVSDLIHTARSFGWPPE